MRCQLKGRSRRLKASVDWLARKTPNSVQTPMMKKARSQRRSNNLPAFIMVPTPRGQLTIAQPGGARLTTSIAELNGRLNLLGRTRHEIGCVPLAAAWLLTKSEQHNWCSRSIL